jgi:tRNA-uridine 2-sulfurtransferase
LPLDGLEKSEVRALASSYGLPNRSRPDSQGLCFLGKISFRDFIRHHLGTKTGKIVERDTGKVLGQHEGYWFHTIGQRKGLNLAGGPWFVVSKDVTANTIFVDHQNKQGGIIDDRFLIKTPHWLSGPPATNQLRVKIRHGANSYPCEISWRGDHSTLEVKLAAKDKGIAAGQFAALYQQDTCIGGGTMDLWLD